MHHLSSFSQNFLVPQGDWHPQSHPGKQAGESGEAAEPTPVNPGQGGRASRRLSPWPVAVGFRATCRTQTTIQASTMNTPKSIVCLDFPRIPLAPSWSLR